MRCCISRKNGTFEVRMSEWVPPPNVAGEAQTTTVKCTCDCHKVERSKEAVVRVSDNFDLSDKVIHHNTDGNDVSLDPVPFCLHKCNILF